MKYDPNIHHRKSIRLKNYDYSQAGLYFVTIVTQNRECLFGDIVGGEIVLNNAGEMVKKLWLDIKNNFSKIKLHEFIIMPNHIHGIIQIVGADSISARTTDSISARTTDSISARTTDSISARTTDSISARTTDSISARTTDSIKRAEIDSAPTAVGSTDIPRIIQSFKRHTTIEYIKMVKQNILPPFDKRIWQRNYWEHVIRNENERQQIAQYIIDNPKKWDMDKLNGGIGNQVMETRVSHDKEEDP